MGMSEQYFWESTPKKIIALIDQKREIEKAKIKNLAVFIASYVWGKDPEEGLDDGLVAGRDKPIDPSALKGLMM